MCMQCMATAMTVGAGATGARSWLAARSPKWLTPRRLKQASAAILVAGVVASGVHTTPNGGADSASAAAPPSATQSH